MYVEPKKNHTLRKNKNIYSLIVYIFITITLFKVLYRRESSKDQSADSYYK